MYYLRIELHEIDEENKKDIIKYINELLTLKGVTGSYIIDNE